MEWVSKLRSHALYVHFLVFDFPKRIFVAEGLKFGVDRGLTLQVEY